MHSMQGPKPELGVPWYGTRYGHNLAEQVNQHMLHCTVLYRTVPYCTVLYCTVSNTLPPPLFKLLF